jgi:hypothetical protein
MMDLRMQNLDQNSIKKIFLTVGYETVPNRQPSALSRATRQ